MRLAGDGEPARLRKLPTRNRDHAVARIRPLMGSEPGMPARMQAGGRAPGATGRPVGAWGPVSPRVPCPAGGGGGALVGVLGKAEEARGVGQARPGKPMS